MDIERLWYARSLPAHALRPLAFLYGLAAHSRRSLYRHRIARITRLQLPVVVVGNISVGGTGKTPLTQWLAERLQAHGRRPGVVVRSYRASARTAARVRGQDDPALYGDEAVLLAAALACPVWSGPVRADTARAMAAAHPELDTVLCDDGLQHYALARDVEIAVVDAARGFGNRWLLPAGPLREPIARLHSVDALVLHGTQTPPLLPAAVPLFRLELQGEAFRNLCDPQQIAAAERFRGKRLVAIAGIGNPQRFFRQLERLRLSFEARAFPDHHRYVAEDLRFPAADAILMTEKDAIKCRRFAHERMWTLPVTARTSEELAQLVLGRIRNAQRNLGEAQAPMHGW
jgi:tetraacyldisaccharide 4'-kinase